jgi:DNA-binding MarR family transcriptional regulator
MKSKPSRGVRYEALIQVLRTSERLWEASRRFFEQWDLSPSQFNVLNVLSDAGEGLTQSDLSRNLLMHRSNVTGLVDRLEKRGLVSREPIPSDRRAWKVVLTAQGRKMLEKILPRYYAAAEEVWGTVTVPRANQLAADLAALGERAEMFLEGPQ